MIRAIEKSAFYFTYTAPVQDFHHGVTSFKANVDRCNNMANQFQNSGTVLSHKNVSRLEDLNKR